MRRGVKQIGVAFTQWSLMGCSLVIKIQGVLHQQRFTRYPRPNQFNSKTLRSWCIDDSPVGCGAKGYCGDPTMTTPVMKVTLIR